MRTQTVLNLAGTNLLQTLALIDDAAPVDLIRTDGSCAVQIFSGAMTGVMTIQTVDHAVSTTVFTNGTGTTYVKQTFPLGHHLGVNNRLAAMLVHIGSTLGELLQRVETTLLEEVEVSHDGITYLLKGILIILNIQTIQFGTQTVLEDLLSSSLTHGNIVDTGTRQHLSDLSVAEHTLLLIGVQQLQLTGVGADTSTECPCHVIKNNGNEVILSELSLTDGDTSTECTHLYITGVIGGVDTTITDGMPAMELSTTATCHNGSIGTDHADLTGRQMQTYDTQTATIVYDHVGDHHLIHNVDTASVGQVIHLTTEEIGTYSPGQTLLLLDRHTVLTTVCKNLTMIDGFYERIEVFAQILPCIVSGLAVDQLPASMTYTGVVPPQSPGIPAHCGCTTVTEYTLIYHHDLLTSFQCSLGSPGSSRTGTDDQQLGVIHLILRSALYGHTLIYLYLRSSCCLRCFGSLRCSGSLCSGSSAASQTQCGHTGGSTLQEITTGNAIFLHTFYLLFGFFMEIVHKIPFPFYSISHIAQRKVYF